MSRFYNPKRKRNLFDPNSKQPYSISRSKIDLFLDCPRCFYLDRRLGTGRPPGFPFSLNRAVDELLKKEFDIHRVKKTSHPLMEEYGIDALPFQHKDLEEWRNNFKGIRHLHKETGLLIKGAVDDIWESKGKLHVIEYKATSKKSEVSLDADWQISYKRQVEVYQWLFRKNGFDVSNTSYFVYCNGDTDKKAFDKKIEFDIKVIPYIGNTDWVDKTIIDISECLRSDEIPKKGEDCDFCLYREEVKKIES